MRLRGRETEGTDVLRPKTAASDEPDIPFTEDELAASLCRESFYDFVKEFWEEVIPEKPNWNWHIKYLCDELQKMAERVFRGEAKEYDLVVNISPGTTKSTIMSIMFPAWIWTRMPTARFIGASYAHPLAMDLSRKNRDVITSDKYQSYFPEIRLREDQNTKAYFQNTKGGYRYAVGVNGSVTGMHGHFIVIDDPLDPNRASSDADLKASNHWIKETLSSRKVDRLIAPMILVMQRLHQDDPTALFLKRKKVKHICLPARLADNVHPPELRLFYKNKLMDPVRLNSEVLNEARRDMGEQGYSSQYRQSPVPPGGAMFKVDRLNYSVSLPTRWQKVVRFWDKAGTKGGGAYTVGTKMGKDLDGRYWVLDVVRFQEDSFNRERIIANVADADGVSVIIGVEQEPGSGGKESAENTVRRLAGFRVQVVKVSVAEGDKINRADAFSTQVNEGNVFLKTAHWNEDFSEELKFFPASKYKDQVDSASGAFNMLARRRVRIGGMDV